jgi:hypothetical protein
MVTRCGNPKASNFAYYGGRGISVCDRWKKFPAFLEDMGLCPDGLSIDRLNSNGNYEKSNCRWATKREQANNTSRNRTLVVRGEAMGMTAAAQRFGLSVGTVWARLNRGDSDEQALRPLLGYVDAWAAEQPEMQGVEA